MQCGGNRFLGRVLVVLALIGLGTAVAAPAEDFPIYQDASQPIERRIDDLIRRMTLEEKISLLHGNTKFTVAGVPRLGIPELCMSDGPHGVREDVSPDSWKPAGHTDDYATWLPSLLGLAATWDPAMAESHGRVIGQEAVRRGKNVMLGPGVNIQRTPLGGRNFEYFGEDPFLSGRMAVGFIHGEQSQGIAACVKHFAANNQEFDRMSVDVEMDERTLREIYLPAFKAAIEDGHVLTLMGAYNKFRGDHCCENDYLLNKILKGEWGFQGLVMSDWAGVHDTLGAALGGMDMEMGTEKPSDQYYMAQPLLEAVRSGEVPVSVIDDKVRRHLRVMIALHMLDPQTRRPVGAQNTPDHQQAARKEAEEGLVLLKNDGGFLPLDVAKIHSIAVIGQNAVRKFAHSGGSSEIKALYEITPLDGIVNRVNQSANVSFSMGYVAPPPRQRQQGEPAPTAPDDPGPDADLIARAVQAAKSCDVAVVVAGLSHDPFFDSEGADRVSLKLPYGQDELIRQVAAANPKTVVVIISGGAVGMDQWLDRVPSVIQAFYPGMEGGTAIAEVLFGDVNPSGKLPCTFPRRLADSPAHALNTYPGQDGVEQYKEGLLVGYRWYDAKLIDPLFAFGHGLSYTTFQYSNLKLIAGDVTTVQCDIANTGSRDGEEVVQVYVSQAHPSLPRPPKELKGFEKILVKAGQKQTVSIPLKIDAFSYYDPSKSGWVAEKGKFTILVGSSSRDIRLQSDFTLSQTTTTANSP